MIDIVLLADEINKVNELEDYYGSYPFNEYILEDNRFPFGKYFEHNLINGLNLYTLKRFTIFSFFDHKRLKNLNSKFLLRIKESSLAYNSYTELLESIDDIETSPLSLPDIDGVINDMTIIYVDYIFTELQYIRSALNLIRYYLSGELRDFNPIKIDEVNIDAECTKRDEFFDSLINYYTLLIEYIDKYQDLFINEVNSYSNIKIIKDIQKRIDISKDGIIYE